MPADRCAGRCAWGGRPLAVDLFAGVGMWSLGMERAGFAAVAACEIDPWKRAVYARHFPDARLYDDVRTLTGDRLRADGVVPAVVVGSPPCKEYSAANSKGRGIDGDDLFLEFVRLVAELGPRWACAENSPRIRTLGFDRIAREFEGAGYACRAYVLGAIDLGAPHIRKRAWIIANRNDIADAALSRSDARPAQTGWEKRPRPVDRNADDAPDAAPDGRGQGRPGRSDSGRAREQGELGAWRPADASDAARIGSFGLGYAEIGANEWPGFAGYVEAARDPDRAGLAQRQGERGDARPELAALERTIGAQGLGWNGGPGRYLDLADGLASGMARRVAAAAGDSILPQIAEMIGRAILALDPALRGGSAP